MTLAPALAHADPPAPFNQCSSAPLPAPAPAPAANTLIINGQMTAVGQEQNYETLANSAVTLAFRSVAQPTTTYPGSNQFSYEPPVDNNQIQYWQENGYPFYYTAVSSDFANVGMPLYITQCDGDAALRMSEDRGLYIHELVAYAASNNGWDWAGAADAITASDWQILNYWVELAAALNKKVIWSEPALGWQALLANSTAQSYFQQWGSTLVPMFATNYDTESSGYDMGLARQAAVQAASTYGMSLGESIQSWWFRQQTDLAAQAGLPTSGATGTPPTACSNSGTSGYELDPLNTDSYSYDGGCYGDPGNGTLAQDEPSLTPTAGATLALADFGATVGATYYQVEGVDGSYKVAEAGTAEAAVNDMDWATLDAPSAYLQGIQAFSTQLGDGTAPPSEIPTTGLYQLWDAAATSHYYTTQTSTGGIPLQPDGSPAANCEPSPTTTYCYQNTDPGATPVPAGYVATSQVSGSVALYQYERGGSQYYYGQNAPGGGFTLSSTTPVGYVVTSERPGTEPFYQLYLPSQHAYFYTTDAGQRASALSAYEDEGVGSYLFTFPNMPAVPVQSGSPTISGATTVGDTLSESHGSWSNGPTNYTYQWEDCDAAGQDCAPILGANGQTYVIGTGDVGQRIAVTERASNSGGLTITPATSQPTAVVVPPTPASSSPPTISGSAIVGQTLGESHGGWSNSPTGYAYQWEECNAAGADCTTIAGATSQSYVLTAADLGDTILVAETASNAGGAGAAASSAPTGPVMHVGIASAGRAHAHGYSLRFTATCVGATSCAVSETLSTLETRRYKRGHSKRVRRIVGTAAQRIGAGERLVVSVALDAQGRGLLLRGHPLSVGLSVRQEVGATDVTVSAQTVVIKEQPPRKPRRARP
ncbi:MAG: hypothetical protein ABSC56_01625 [Solirubrobacteraceae bacterium]|jgi:hypothetical protein